MQDVQYHAKLAINLIRVGFNLKEFYNINLLLHHINGKVKGGYFILFYIQKK